ncbi:MAG: hypothetical protein K0R11_440 [Acidimicrobiales bacterium]|nr:hypothetical protein [Acidimicrobiales bacterium]
MLSRLLIAVVFLAPVIWGLVDVIRRPKAAFVAAGRTRGIWIGLLLLALLAPILVGTGIGIWYLVAVRPKVAAATPTPTPDER